MAVHPKGNKGREKYAVGAELCNLVQQKDDFNSDVVPESNWIGNFHDDATFDYNGG